MRNVLGNNVTLTLFGESHNDAIGAVLDGFPAGVKVDYEKVKELLFKRRPQNIFETKRIEEDNFKFVSGVFNGYTTGAPICVLIENKNIQSNEYEKFSYLPRPSHADYVAHEKYKGYEDYRGGGHFSGRITASIVAIAGLVIPFLESKGIKIATHIKECANIKDIDLVDVNDDIKKFNDYIDILNKKNFPVINDIEKEIITKLDEIAKEGNSIGGICQTVITGLEVGLGEPWFSSVESMISSAVFAIGGVKGIEFGRGFAFNNMTGKNANDEFVIKENKIQTNTNNNGGINGGISNGMPIIFNSAIKPTPSIALAQNTVNLKTLEPQTLEIKGRHDPAIIRRIAIVITSITALVVLDLLASKNNL